MAQLGIGMFMNICFDQIPIPFIGADPFAVGANRDDSLHLKTSRARRLLPFVLSGSRLPLPPTASPSGALRIVTARAADFNGYAKCCSIRQRLDFGPVWQDRIR